MYSYLKKNNALVSMGKAHCTFCRLLFRKKLCYIIFEYEIRNIWGK